jgi:alkylation response protein AidB-like acyl-CoA dehydrogenase
MDFDLSEEQSAILDAAGGLLAKHGGPARATELMQSGRFDAALEAALEQAGFCDVVLAQGTGPLEAALLTEAVSYAAGTVAYGAGAMVAPCVVGRRLGGPVALVTDGENVPVRFGAHARTALVLAQDRARVVALDTGAATVVKSEFGYPMGRFVPGALADGEVLAPGSGAALRNWWRVALAAETSGAMRAALDVTVEYLKNRRQFGRAIGSFQAVQHRLAECKVLVESSKWLAFDAAWRGAPADAAACAAAHSVGAAARLFRETHQLSGAIGFTREHDLHVWTMRLQALRLELGGLSAHSRAIADTRWG